MSQLSQGTSLHDEVQSLKGHLEVTADAGEDVGMEEQGWFCRCGARSWCGAKSLYRTKKSAVPGEDDGEEKEGKEKNEGEGEETADAGDDDGKVEQVKVAKTEEEGGSSENTDANLFATMVHLLLERFEAHEMVLADINF